MHQLTVCMSLGLLGCGRIDFDRLADAPVRDGAAATCPSFAVFCDGFESGDITRWSSSALPTGATLTATTSVVHSGTYALDAVMPPLQEGAGAYVIYTFPTQTTGRLALREHVFMPEQLDSYDGVITFTGGLGKYVGLYVAPDLMWAVSENSPGGGLADVSTTVPAQPGRWYCVELEVLFSPPTVTVHIDDTQILMTPMADPSPSYNEAAGGATRASVDGSRAIIDDAVVANQHIGCL